MGYRAQRMALQEVAKRRNRYGDYAGSADSSMKAWGLEEAEAARVASEGRDYPSLTPYIVEELSHSFENVGDIPRAIKFLDEAIASITTGHQIAETSGVIEVWEDRRNELFEEYDSGNFEYKNYDVTGDIFAEVCRYCTDTYLEDAVTAIREKGERVFELHVFSWIPRIKLMRQSITADLDVNVFDDLGGLPLYYAAQTSNVEAVNVLLEAGAEVNTPSEDHWTPVMAAAESGNVNVLNSLLEAGADFSYAGEGGWTALHRAGAKGHIDVARRLIEVGADVKAIDEKGLTPEGLADEEGYDLSTVL